MMDIIFQLINNTFEKDYFLGFGYSKKTETTIQHQIEAFNQKFPQATQELLCNLRKNFPQGKIENITQFFNWDRCIRFLVQLTEEKRFICQLSIYGYFSVYQSPCWFKDGSYTYGEKKFLNPEESEVADVLYNCANVLTTPPIWLDRVTLKLIVFDFSIPKINYTYIINVGDALFTNHMI